MNNAEVLQARLALIFNEWAKRYAAAPEEFGPILDEIGQPVTDYGESCAIYFGKIAKEMDAAGLLPRPEEAAI